MKLYMNCVVDKVRAEGNGIPFSPRTMWAVKVWISSDNFPSAEPTTFPVYWSKRVALRAAAEQLWMQQVMVHEELSRIRAYLPHRQDAL